MYWRRSLTVTVFLSVVTYGLSAASNAIMIPLYLNASLSASNLADAITILNLGMNAVLHFLVLWWVFRRYAPDNEKIRRKKRLRPEELIQMLNEDELGALRDHLLPPSRRTNDS